MAAGVWVGTTAGAGMAVGDTTIGIMVGVTIMVGTITMLTIMVEEDLLIQIEIILTEPTVIEAMGTTAIEIIL